MLSFSDAPTPAKKSTSSAKRVLRQRKESPSVNNSQPKTAASSVSKGSKASKGSKESKGSKSKASAKEEHQERRKKSTTSRHRCADCHKQFQSQTSVKKHGKYCPVKRSENVAAASDSDSSEDLIVTRMTSRSDRIKSAKKELEQETTIRTRTRSSLPMNPVESNTKKKKKTEAKAAALDQRHIETEPATKVASKGTKKPSKFPSKEELRKERLNGNDFIHVSIIFCNGSC